MRVLFVIPSLLALASPRSGVLAQARSQADALRARGHEVLLGSSWDPPHPAGIDIVHFFQGGLGLVGIQKLKGHFDAPLVFAPIIDSNESNRSYRLAARAGSLHPRFVTVPGVLREQASASDLVVCRSSYEQRRVVDGLGIPLEKTKVVLNGASVLETTGDPDQELSGLGIPTPFLFHLSIYSDERKNVARLIRATADLGVKLVIAGAAVPGEAREGLERLGRRMGHVIFLSEVTRTQLAALYQRCRVFCLPSLHEGTGLSALEAAALGAQVVITSRGGPPDYFGRNAHYVDPFDESSIRAGISAALAAASTGELARHVRATISWEASAQQLEHCYLKLVDRR